MATQKSLSLRGNRFTPNSRLHPPGMEGEPHLVSKRTVHGAGRPPFPRCYLSEPVTHQVRDWNPQFRATSPLESQYHLIDERQLGLMMENPIPETHRPRPVRENPCEDGVWLPVTMTDDLEHDLWRTRSAGHYHEPRCPAFEAFYPAVTHRQNATADFQAAEAVSEEMSALQTYLNAQNQKLETLRQTMSESFSDLLSDIAELKADRNRSQGSFENEQPASEN